MTNEIPSIRLKLILDGLLDVLRSNQESSYILEENKFLYKLFNGIVIGKYNFYTEASSLISRSQKDANKLETRLMFDIDRANMPTIHIHMPADNQGSVNSIGMNIGNNIESLQIASNQYVPGRSFTGMYDLIITSINPIEVQLIYELVMALLISSKDTLNHHFIKFNFSGKELIPNSSIVPMNTYMKAITVKLDYERRVPLLYPDYEILNIILNGKTIT